MSWVNIISPTRGNEHCSQVQLKCLVSTLPYPFQSYIYQYSLSSLLLYPEEYYWSLAKTTSIFFSNLLVFSSRGICWNLFVPILYYKSFSYVELFFSLDLFPSLSSMEMRFCGWCFNSCLSTDELYWVFIVFRLVGYPIHLFLVTHCCLNPLPLISDPSLVFFPHNFLPTSIASSSLIMGSYYLSCIPHTVLTGGQWRQVNFLLSYLLSNFVLYSLLEPTWYSSLHCPCFCST